MSHTAGTGVDYAEGIKLTDPRRMAVYFAKYGTGGRKDYQHRIPPEWLAVALVCDDCEFEYDADVDGCPACGCPNAELVETGTGPGRFWGYRGLMPVLATRQVMPGIGIAAGRVLRRWYRAKALTKTVLVERVEQATGRVRLRRTRKRRRLFVHGRGFVCVNDGPAFASQLAPYLGSLSSPPITRSAPARPAAREALGLGQLGERSDLRRAGARSEVDTGSARRPGGRQTGGGLGVIRRASTPTTREPRLPMGVER